MSNVLLILADDMRWDELKYMPNVKKLLQARGTTFGQTLCEAPICSPTRAGILTGQYSTNHLTTTQTDTPSPTHRANSVFKALDNAGQRCGMIGKFFTALSGGSVSAGFEFWRGLKGDTQDSYDYQIYDGTTTLAPAIYQEHYLCSQALEFILTAQADEVPWTLWYNPTNPHWPDVDAPPNHQDEWAYHKFPVTIETDVSDKPAWIQALSNPTSAELLEIRAEERMRLRELLAVDDTVGALVNTINATGQADDTTIIFTSDNGVFAGEHRLFGGAFARVSKKNILYTEALRVPMIVVGPDFEHQTIDTVATNHQDITATLLDLCGATTLTSDQVGSSLVDIAADPSDFPDRYILHTRDSNGAGSDDGMPDSNGCSDYRYTFVEHLGETSPDQYELYDRLLDPHMLVNQAYSGGAWLTRRNAMAAARTTLLA